MNKINKEDILGIVDYLMSGTYLDTYQINDDDEEFNVWVKTCVNWLKQEANKLEE